VSRRYTFTHRWSVAAPAARVQEVLNDLERYPDWWPQIRAVAKIDDDNARVVCRSVLPYDIDLYLTAIRRDPLRLETVLSGDLEGTARWRLHPDGETTHLEYEQDVLVTGRLLGILSVVLRRPLAWNHDRMMAGCRDGLDDYVSS
jgi:carbon monoxide dehydrogenase subunit G